jgi:hypothetical protein
MTGSIADLQCKAVHRHKSQEPVGIEDRELSGNVIISQSHLFQMSV